MTAESTKRQTDAAEFGAELRRALRLSESRRGTATGAGDGRESLMTASLILLVVVGIVLIAGAAWTVLA